MADKQRPEAERSGTAAFFKLSEEKKMRPRSRVAGGEEANSISTEGRKREGS